MAGFPGVATSEPIKAELTCEGRMVAGCLTSETSSFGFREVRAGKMVAEGENDKRGLRIETKG